MAQQETISSTNEIIDQKPKKKRIWEIDFIRGVAILGMCVDHLLWDLGNLNSFFFNFREVDIAWVNQMGIILRDWYNGGRQYFHNLAFLFFIICGISSTFSRNNWKHSLKIFVASLILFVGTYALYHVSYLIDPHSALDFRICFGVLYALAMGTLFVSLIPSFCHLVMVGIEKIKKTIKNKKGQEYTEREIAKKPSFTKWIYLGLGLALIISWIIVTYTVFYPAKGIQYDSFSTWWYYWIRKYDAAPYVYLVSPAQAKDGWTAFFGLSFSDFMLSLVGLRSMGSDFFSLIPWVGWTLIGAFLGETVYKKKESLLPKLDGKWNKPFAWAGNQSLWIYIFHQVVWVILIALVFCPMGYRFF